MQTRLLKYVSLGVENRRRNVSPLRAGGGGVGTVTGRLACVPVSQRKSYFCSLIIHSCQKQTRRGDKFFVLCVSSILGYLVLNERARGIRLSTSLIYRMQCVLKGTEDKICCFCALFNSISSG